jgi:hypothetical protein
MTASWTRQAMKLHTQEIVVLSTASDRNCTGHRKAWPYRRATCGGLGCCVPHPESTVTTRSCCVLRGLVVLKIGLEMGSGPGGFDFEAQRLLETKEDSKSVEKMR